MKFGPDKKLIRQIVEVLDPQTDDSNNCPLIRTDGKCGFPSSLRRQVKGDGPLYINSKGQCVADVDAVPSCGYHLRYIVLNNLKGR